MWQVFSTVMAK